MVKMPENLHRYLAVSLIAAVLLCAFLPAVSAEMPETEKTRIKSVIPYVTKTDNGVSQYIPVESREDMAINPNSVSLRIQIYVNAADAEKYFGLQIYIFKLRPYEEITDISGAQYESSFDVRENNAFSYSIDLMAPDLQNLRSGAIYGKFVAGVKEGDEFVPISDARYIDNINALSDKKASPPVLKSKKGLSVQIPGEARILGVEYATVDLYLNDFLAAEESSNTEIYSYANENYYFNIDKIAEYDKKIKSLTNEGINVTASILLDAQKFIPKNSGDGAEDPGNDGAAEEKTAEPSAPVDPVEYLIHPNALASAQAGGAIYYGINTTDEPGVRYFEALMSFIADRYVSESGGFGRIYNIILGRDIGFSALYNNCGRMDIVSYVKNYLRALRICDTAVRSRFGGSRVYVPFDNWFAKQGTDFVNKHLIDCLCEYSEKEGNFIWNIAWNVYNDERMSPEIWKDTEPADDFETPVINIKNIKVLCDYINLEKNDYLPDGELRKVMLSSQGFSSGDNSTLGQNLQAAAFVYAYLKAKYIPDITAFIYNEQVDNKNEITGGSFGLWTNAPDTVNEPGEKKRIYDVFKYIDTNREYEKIEFAKEIIGIENFEEIAPLYSKDTVFAAFLREVTGETLKSTPNSTNIGIFNNAELSGFMGTSNIFKSSVPYTNPDSGDFNGKNMLFAGFSKPTKGDFGGIFKIFTPAEPAPDLEGEKYVGARLRIDTAIDMPEDQKIQLVLIMESEAPVPEDASGAGTLSIFEGLANISPNKDETVYFDISSWTERTDLKRIKLLVNPYADKSAYLADCDSPGGYDFNLYVYSIISGHISKMSWIKTLLTVILAVIGLLVLGYAVLYIRARIIKKKRKKMRELQKRRAAAAMRARQGGRPPGPPPQNGGGKR